MQLDKDKADDLELGEEERESINNFPCFKETFI